MAALAALLLALCAPSWARFEAAPVPGPAAPVIVLDPGHGGDDLGAVIRGKREKDLALEIARRVRDQLEAMGVGPVWLTRDDDFYVPLDHRVAGSVDLAASAFVSLHINQAKQKNREGIIVFTFGKTRANAFPKGRWPGLAPLPEPPRETVIAGSSLAQTIVGTLKEKGFRVDPPARAPFYVLKNPAMPSVLIELGFLSNPKEAARLVDPGYQERLAHAVALSLASHLSRDGAATSAGR